MCLFGRKMNIAKKLGLEVEPFCRMILTTKMLLSNVLGHAAELHYEKYLIKNNIKFQKAPTDTHYDYVLDIVRDQVKRWETSSTNKKKIGVNLVQTHGNRSGEGAFYTTSDFDRLILFDVGFNKFKIINMANIPRNPKFAGYITGKFGVPRNEDETLFGFDLEFLTALKIKNTAFPEAIENLRRKYNLTYVQLLEKCCNLTLKEIDSLFSEENFRLITGAKGFAAEEHFNIFLKRKGIQYKQMKDMYNKVDHLVKGRIRVQVKIPHQKSVDENHWAFKTHKSHGHGLLELYKANEFDIVALFIGFEIDESKSRYFPISVKEEFIFVPVSDLERYPKNHNYLKRVNKIRKDRYKVNDISLLN